MLRNTFARKKDEENCMIRNFTIFAVQKILLRLSDLGRCSGQGILQTVTILSLLLKGERSF
jgi:hypothetical protein